MPKKSDSTKKHLIYTALQLFTEHGYQNVSVKDICEAADVQRGTFYYHFSNKEDIIDSFYDNIQIPEDYQSTIITTTNSWLKLWLLHKPSIDWTIETGPDIVSTILIINLQKSCSTFFPTSVIGTQKNILEIIEHGQKIGHFHNQLPPKQLSHIIVNQILGICLSWCSRKGDFDEAKEIHDALISILQVDESLIEETKKWLRT